MYYQHRHGHQAGGVPWSWTACLRKGRRVEGRDRISVVHSTLLGTLMSRHWWRLESVVNVGLEPRVHMPWYAEILVETIKQCCVVNSIESCNEIKKHKQGDVLPVRVEQDIILDSQMSSFGTVEFAVRWLCFSVELVSGQAIMHLTKHSLLSQC